MKVWTVILAGVLLAALPNLGTGALEDAGVFVSNDYTTFVKRVLPGNTPLICTMTYYEYEWFQINKFEQLLLEFANGNNTMKAKIPLGTPAILVAFLGKVDFNNPVYCKYLPKPFHNATGLRNSKASKLMMYSPLQYYAVKINATERATIQQGWNYLLNVVKNRFPTNQPSNYVMMIVEKTAAGVIYVGAVQNYTYNRIDDRAQASLLGYLH